MLNKQERFGLLVAALLTARPDLPHEQVVQSAGTLQREAKIIRKSAAQRESRLALAKSRIEGNMRKIYGYTASYTSDGYTILDFPVARHDHGGIIVISVA